jgi:hypothetical protein
MNCSAIGCRLSAVLLTATLLACTAQSGDETEGRGVRPAESDLLDCGAGQDAGLTGSGVGALRIGATVAEIRRKCLVVSDTTLAQGNEGMPERRLTALVGSETTTATIVDDRVWRIEINSPRFRTTDSLGVGSTVRDLRGPEASLALGEGAYVLRKDHCGLSFHLTSAVGAFGKQLAAVPDSTQVRRVLVTGC